MLTGCASKSLASAQQILIPSVDEDITINKGINEYCRRNYECDSGCCNWGKLVPGYGWGMCDDKSECYWLQNEEATHEEASANAAQCPNQLDFGPPEQYKISVGNARIRKRGNGLEIDRFGDGTVFFSAAKSTGIGLWVKEDGRNQFVNAGLTFTDNRQDAATFNVSVSQYGRKLSITDQVLTKHPDNDNGLQMRNDAFNAAIVVFTKYVEPTWKEDTGAARDKIMLELAEKVCGSNITCVDVLAQYLQPEKLDEFTSCEQ